MTVPPADDDLPRSPTGRIPQWVRDEAAGRAATPTAWRTDDVPLRAARTLRRTRPRRRRGDLVTRLVPPVVVVALLAAWVVPHPGGLAGAWHDLTGAGDAYSAGPVPGAAGTDAPPPGLEESPEPLGTPPTLVDSTAPHAFLATWTAPDGEVRPVTWSPCRPIHYVVGTVGAPADFAARVAGVVTELEGATGLVFVDDGETTEPASEDRAPYQPDRYGDRWAPVLVSFTEEASEDDEEVAGIGGPTSVSHPEVGVPHAVSGFAYVDADMLRQPDVEGEPAYVGVLRHELGHLVGLGHVEDPAQLMHDTNYGVFGGYQTGDLAGLAALGAGECAPEV